MTAMRLDALRHSMRSGRVHALLVTHLPHVRYLTGFSGSNAACLLTQRSFLLATDSRYALQVRDEVVGARTLIVKGSLSNALLERIRIPSRMRVGFASSALSVRTHTDLRKKFPRVSWVAMDAALTSVFSIKEEHELRAMREASAISDAVFIEMLGVIRPGMKEADVAAEISYRHRIKGADGDAFEPIVASGVRGALPHAGASEKRIRSGELVTLDFGCRVRGLCSDITRTIAVGKVAPRLRSLYHAVLGAQLSALAGVRAGVPGRAADAEARRVLRSYKLERWFRHSLGHGLGLEVHEHPRLAPKSPDILEEGQVVTVEPGVYVPGLGGVRIEDDVVVTASGIELLTHAPKDLIVL